MSGELLKELTTPLFTGAIGYLTNWTGVWMLFYPIRFAGWRVPGLSRLAPLLPRRVQQIPGSCGAAPFGRDFGELCLPAQVREPDAGEDGNSSG